MMERADIKPNEIGGRMLIDSTWEQPCYIYIWLGTIENPGTIMQFLTFQQSRLNIQLQ